MNLADQVALSDHARRHDVVISLVPQASGQVQLACARTGVPSVDASGGTSADLLAHADAVASERGSGHIVGVGLFPGLSGLMAHEVAAVVPGRRLAVTLVQSSNARVGPAGVREMLGMVEPGPGVRRGADVLLRLEHPEATALAHSGIEAEYFTRWDSRSQTRTIGVLAALGLLPMLTRLPDRWLRRLAPHRPDACEEAVLTVRAAGAEFVARAEVRSDYEATAALLAATAIRAANFTPGVLPLWGAVELSTIAAEISDVVSLSGLAPVAPATEDSPQHGHPGDA